MDCLGLLIAVAKTLDLHGKHGDALLDYDRQDYGWRPDGARLKAMLATHLHEIPTEAALPADVLLFTLGGNPQHVGICTQLPDGRPGLLHAYAPIGKVVEHGFGGAWPQRLCAAFRLPQATNQHMTEQQD